MEKFFTTDVKPDDLMQYLDELTEYEIGCEKPPQLSNLDDWDFFRGLPSVFDIMCQRYGALLHVPVMFPVFSRELRPVLKASTRDSVELDIFGEPRQKLPAATDVIHMLSKLNKQLAGSEVTLQKYFESLQQQNGYPPIMFLRQRHRTDEKIMEFITLNANLQNPVEITPTGKLRIKDSQPKLEANDDQRTTATCTFTTACTVSNDSPTLGSEYTYLANIPYSTAFKHELIPSGNQVDAMVGPFAGGRELKFHFTTTDEINLRNELLTRINSESCFKAPSHVYRGMPCLALDDTTSETSQYNRAVVIDVENSQVCQEHNFIAIIFQSIDNSYTCLLSGISH